MHGTPAVPSCATCDVRQTAVCGALDTERLNALSVHALTQTYLPEETVFIESYPCKHYFNIVRGVARLSKSLADGRRQIVGFGYANSLAGYTTDIDYPYTMEAISELVVCRFPRRAFETNLDRSDELKTAFIKRTQRELSRCRDHIVLLGKRTAMERLAFFLYESMSRSSISGGTSGGTSGTGHTDRTEVWLPMSREDIADFLGLTTETVSRAFTKLRQSGTIDMPCPKHLYIKDAEGLRALAHD